MNLLVIVADTFRADYLGCYGNPHIQTPRLDRLASEGVGFTDFYAEGMPTIPSRRVLMTGRKIFPFLVAPQKGDPVALPGWHPLFYEDVTIAEWLSQQGYTTGLVSDVYHMFKPGKNFQRGFHSWQWIRGQEADPLVPTPQPDFDLSHYLRPEQADHPWLIRFVAQYVNNRSWWKAESDHYAAQVMRAAADWLRKYGHKKPWMLWVESFDPHEPWDAPEAFVGKYYDGDYAGRELLWPPSTTAELGEDEFHRVQAHYAGEVSHTDKWIGYLLDALEIHGMADDTLVVFLSDHGTMMGEQGQIHKGQERLRIQCTRCPLLIRHPDKQHAGKAMNGFVQHHDLMPTLLGLLGQPVPERVNGQDFWPLVTGDADATRREWIVSGFGWYASIRTAEWNYQTAWALPEGVTLKPPELYHTADDAEELHNVIDDHQEVAEELHARLNELLNEQELTAGSLEGPVTPAAIPGLQQ